MKPRRHSLPSRSRGFTLLELLLVVALSAVMVGLAGPAFVDALQRGRQQSALGRMGSAIAFARGESVVRASSVALCPSNDKSSCTGSTWESGWLVFEDNGEGAGGVAQDGLLNGSEELLSIADGTDSGITVRSSNNSFVAGSNSIVFLPSGRLLGNAAGTLVICDARGATEARGLVINVSGQRRFALDSDADTLREDHADQALTCP